MRTFQKLFKISDTASISTPSFYLSSFISVFLHTLLFSTIYSQQPENYILPDCQNAFHNHCHRSLCCRCHRHHVPVDQPNISVATERNVTATVEIVKDNNNIKVARITYITVDVDYFDKLAPPISRIY